MYYMGKPIWYEYTDPIGHVHKLHKVCAEHNGYKVKPITADTTSETFDISGRYVKC